MVTSKMSSMQHILHLHIEIFSVTQKWGKQIQILSVHRPITVFIYTLSYQNVQFFPDMFPFIQSLVFHVY